MSESTNLPAVVADSLALTTAKYQGGLAREMSSICERLVTVLGFKVEEADIITKQVAKDTKAHQKSAVATLKVGKHSKGGDCSIAETVKSKGQTTPALRLVHALQWMAEAGKHDISYGFTKWAIGVQLKEEIQTLLKG